MKFLLLLSALGFCWAQYAPNTKPGRTSIVHLFEWRWADIALECERYLGPKGFGGVQVGMAHGVHLGVGGALETMVSSVSAKLGNCISYALRGVL